MQRPLKELFLGPISILFSTGGEMQGLKVARPRGCWQGESQASRSEKRQGELILWRGRSNQRLIPLPKVQAEEGELLTEKGVLLHYLRSHQKNEEGKNSNFQKETRQYASGSSLKILPQAHLGPPVSYSSGAWETAFLVGSRDRCLLHVEVQGPLGWRGSISGIQRNDAG